MYKVFFNDRALFLTDDFTENFKVKQGLFYKYSEEEELSEILDIYGKVRKINSLIIFNKDIDELRKRFKACFVNMDAAGGVIRNGQGQFLLIKRHGKWDLPKGKLEKKENFETAAIREVEEECGISGAEVIRPLLSTYHTYELDNKKILKKTSWFEMIYLGFDELKPQTEEGISDVRWFAPEELREVFENTYASIIDVFRYMGFTSGYLSEADLSWA